MSIKLLSFVDARSYTLLDHFLNYYQNKIGLMPEQFYLIIHQSTKQQDNQNTLEILNKYDVVPYQKVTEYTSIIKREKINQILDSTEIDQDDWIIYVDLDEFIRFPMKIKKFIEKLDQKAIQIVRGIMIDRLDKKGILKPIQKLENSSAGDLWKQFPVTCYITRTVQKSNYCKAFMIKASFRFFNSHYTIQEMNAKIEIRCIDDLKKKGKAGINFYPEFLLVDHFKWTNQIYQQLKERKDKYQKMKNARMQGNANYYQQMINAIKYNPVKKYRYVKLNTVHLVFSSDRNLLRPLIICMHSILQNTKMPERIFFHLLIDTQESKKVVEDLLKKTLLHLYTFQYEIVIPSHDDINNLAKYIRVQKDQSNISSVMNFARFLFPQYFSNLNKIIYVDIDMIVQDDLAKLYDQKMSGDRPLIALPDKVFKKDMNPEFLKKHKYNPEYQAFNAGFYMTYLNYWREKKLFDRVIKIMKEHQQSLEGNYKFGTQPILNLLFYKKYQYLHKDWHVKDLGFQLRLNPQRLEKAKVLHWNGPAKPWFSNGLYQKYWDKYNFWQINSKPLNQEYAEQCQEKERIRLEKENSKKKSSKKKSSKKKSSKKKSSKKKSSKRK